MTVILTLTANSTFLLFESREIRNERFIQQDGAELYFQAITCSTLTTTTTTTPPRTTGPGRDIREFLLICDMGTLV